MNPNETLRLARKALADGRTRETEGNSKGPPKTPWGQSPPEKKLPVMWLSEKGNVRIDAVGSNLYRFSRWNEQRNDWQPRVQVGERAAMRYIRQLNLTEYPDVPDTLPDMTA